MYLFKGKIIYFN